MTGTVHELSPNQAPAQAAGEAPLLPIEHHIVAAALTAERMRGLSEQMVLFLLKIPRDAATFATLRDEVLAAWCHIDAHYGAYRAVGAGANNYRGQPER